MLYAVPSVNNGFNIDGPLTQGAADSLPWLVNQDGSSSIAAVNLAGSAVTGALKAASFPALTGDITTTAGSLATTLATVNGNVGTWNNVTVNAKGLVTAGSNVSYQGALTLTTTGSSGAATLIGNTLNVPNYAGTTYTFSTGLTNTAGTVTVNTSQNITTLSNLTSAGFVKTSAAGLLSVDTSTYLTANQNITISGDVSGSGTMAITGTLATVNTNTGSFGSSTAIPTFTVNGKGLITAASTAAVVAPAGTLSGTALNATVVTSSLTSVGTLASLVVTGSVTAGSYLAGTLGYTAANLLASFQSSVNSYNQVIVQNSSSGTTASSDFVVNNNNSTDTTFYGDFGMNSSGFTGSGSFNLANAVYLSATSGDLVIGTTTNNNIRFVVNGLTSDALKIDTSGNATFGGTISMPNANTVSWAAGGYIFCNASTGANTGTTRIVAGGGTSCLNFGGDTSSFPAWKRNGANFDARLANDSAYCGLTVGTLSATGHTTFEGVTSTGATGTGNLVYSTSPTFTTPILGTPTSGVLTNCTGSAAGLTAGNVTTNANLTGDVTSVGNAATIALSVVHAWTGAQYFAQASLTDAATITWNANTQQAAYVLLTSAVGGTRVLGAPSNLHAGATYTLIVQQSSTGTNALTYNAVFKFPGGTSPTLSTGNNAIDILTFISDGTSMFGVCQKAFS